MTKIALTFKSVSEIQGVDDIGLLVLVDEKCERQLAVPCEKSLFEAFKKRMTNAVSTAKMLPEVLWKLVESQVGNRMEAFIDSVKNGQYGAVLIDNDNFAELPIYACDAILLSLISKGKVTVTIDKTLFLKQSTPFSRNSKGVSLPLNTITDKMLDAALQRAINNEDYEVASYLRDEINKRNKLRNSNKDNSMNDHEGN
ncbi:UvrB/UvrC motif-containing protein [Hallella sp.]|uniref:UvrB/UvrC motif-containing protein n=1 Tax=Hallella TaxID=52228 RepID=UPI002842A3E1|nr:UvrB/UvrC motif-containing protein [Hallella sp.]MBS7399820.1 UvrB/UvrC motif-containing protein [Prevotella sp.]MCI7434935.1 UvrB/UvrC motif-containing protein [Prevotella sp.]MDR3843435.1 UvrB/UvrC motif-containing protein [Hallella sp.]MDY5924940.1 UvrB/UvrC motif-containing protein [Hallella sp.]MED9945002.1 UvrB/UvrC motif-containing protein [Hallella sp.]